MLGMRGVTDSVPVRGLSGLDGMPGVVGSPGYVLKNWTLPLCTWPKVSHMIPVS